MSMTDSSAVMSLVTVVSVLLWLGLHIALIAVSAVLVRKVGKAGKDASVWLMAAGAVGILTDLVGPIGRFLIQTVMGRSIGVDAAVTALIAFSGLVALINVVGYALLLFGLVKFAKGIRQSDDAPEGNYLGS